MYREHALLRQAQSKGQTHLAHDVARQTTIVAQCHAAKHTGCRRSTMLAMKQVKPMLLDPH